MDWNSFYLGALGASATLMGLLFIAIQLNLDILAADPSNRWRSIARSTFSMYLVLFIVPLLMLIPGLDSSLQATFVILAAGFGVTRSVMTWLPVWRSFRHQRGERFWHTSWLLLAPAAVYLSFGLAAYRLYHNQGSPDSLRQSIAESLAGLFLIALRNSWNLLIEVKREAK